MMNITTSENRRVLMTVNEFNTKLDIGADFLSSDLQELIQESNLLHLDLDQLVPNPLNKKRSLDGIEELAVSIYISGRVEEPLIVLKQGEQYRITSGHRRRLALLHLVNVGVPIEGLENIPQPQFGKNIPAILKNLTEIKLPVNDELKEKYSLNTTNSETREYTEADKYQEYLDLKEIYTEAKKNGAKLSGKMRHIIAKDMKMKIAQVGKIEFIDKNGSEMLKKHLLSGEIEVHIANDLAHLDKNKQEELVKHSKESGQKIDKEIVQAFKNINRSKNEPTLDKETVKKVNNNQKEQQPLTDSFKFRKEEFISFDLKSFQELPDELEVTPVDFQKLKSIKAKIESELEKMKKIILN